MKISKILTFILIFTIPKAIGLDRLYTFFEGCKPQRIEFAVTPVGVGFLSTDRTQINMTGNALANFAKANIVAALAVVVAVNQIFEIVQNDGIGCGMGNGVGLLAQEGGKLSFER